MLAFDEDGRFHEMAQLNEDPWFVDTTYLGDTLVQLNRSNNTVMTYKAVQSADALNSLVIGH